MPIHLWIVHGYFCALLAELSNGERDCMPCNAYNILQKKFADP